MAAPRNGALITRTRFDPSGGHLVFSLSLFNIPGAPSSMGAGAPFCFLTPLFLHPFNRTLAQSHRVAILFPN